MVDSLRRLQLNLITVATVLTATTAAQAKPTITVIATIDNADTNFRKRLTLELKDNNLKETPEQYIAEQFTNVFSVLRMFRFIAVDGLTSSLTLQLRLSSNAERPWPATDLMVTMDLSSGGEPIRFRLLQRAVCGSATCVPRALVDPALYRSLFGEILRQWPSGMLHSVALTTTALYEKGGKIRTIEPLSEFGQADDGVPDALFEILFGTTQRQFAFCLEDRIGNWRALGKDQGAMPVAMPSCIVDAIGNVRGGSNGRVTLLRAFPRVVP